MRSIFIFILSAALLVPSLSYAGCYVLDPDVASWEYYGSCSSPIMSVTYPFDSQLDAHYDSTGINSACVNYAGQNMMFGHPLSYDEDCDGVADKEDDCPSEAGDGPDGCMLPPSEPESCGNGERDGDEVCPDQGGACVDHPPAINSGDFYSSGSYWRGNFCGDGSLAADGGDNIIPIAFPGLDENGEANVWTLRDNSDGTVDGWYSSQYSSDDSGSGLKGVSIGGTPPWITETSEQGSAGVMASAGGTMSVVGSSVPISESVTLDTKTGEDGSQEDTTFTAKKNPDGTINVDKKVKTTYPNGTTNTTNNTFILGGAAVGSTTAPPGSESALAGLGLDPNDLTAGADGLNPGDVPGDTDGEEEEETPVRAFAPPGSGDFETYSGDYEGKGEQFQSRFDSFTSNIAGSALGSSIDNFFSGPSSSGASSMDVDFGRFGSSSFSFAMYADFFLGLKACLLVVITFVGFRIVFLKR